MKRKGNNFKKAYKLKILSAVVLLSTAVFCLAHRLPQCFGSQNPAALAAAVFTLTNGEYRLEHEQSKPAKSDDKKTDSSEADESNKAAQTVTYTSKNKTRDKTGYYDSFASHGGEEKYAVEERSIENSGTQVANFFVKNKTGLSLDFNGLLNAELPFDIEKGINSPQVLIYHTHTSEAYLDEDVDYFYDSYYSRTDNNDFNVVAVGDAIAEELNKRGIKTVHDTTVHDTSYNGSYDRSVQTVEKYMQEYKDIRVVLDIHRDAIGTDERKVKPVFTYNGRKGAQIMILSGCDTDGELGFESWQNNLNFALKIQNTAESMFPGMTRPISFDYFAYNEYVCDGSLLIEMGAEANSIDEAVYSGKLLGEALAKVLLP